MSSVVNPLLMKSSNHTYIVLWNVKFLKISLKLALNLILEKRPRVPLLSWWLLLGQVQVFHDT